MNVLADIGDYGYYTNTSNIVTRSYLQQNRAAIKGFIKGQIEGIHYVKTNKEGSLKILLSICRSPTPKLSRALMNSSPTA